MPQEKIYVTVHAKFDCQGNIKPISIIWQDGSKFDIDKVLDVRRAASLKSGGTGIRYTIQIGKNQRYLYFEDPCWFVEGKRNKSI